MQDREFAVVLEGIRSDFKVFDEGLDQLRQDMKTGIEKLDKKNRRGSYSTYGFIG